MLLPSETALVLGGGGAKGAYEVGVFEALERIGIRAGSVYGTSIGALNAAMVAQGSVSAARELWSGLTLADVVTQESVALAEEAELLFSRPDKVLDFLARNAAKKGVDPSPLRSLMREYIDEDALRRSAVRFGLVCARFPALSRTEKRLEDMAEGSLHDWLMASCACFPAFPMVKIGEDRYIDGGFADNVPVEMAIRAGAKHIIAVDIGRHRAHEQYDRRPNVTYIRASHPLGGLLAFDAAQSARNMALGCNDALRAFGYLRGTQYAFDPSDALRLSARARDFVCFLTAYESQLSGRSPAPLFAALEESLSPGADAVDYFLRALEVCALALEIDPIRVYTFDSMRDALLSALPMEQAASTLSSLLGGRIGALFSPPQPDRKLVLACLIQLLRREGSFPALALHTLAGFPSELLCALTLREIMPE